MLITRVKAAAITNLTDARYFAAREVDWLSFDFSAGSENYISPTEMLAIKEWVDGVKFVGEFNLESISEIRSAISGLQLDAIQLGMAASGETLKELSGEIPVFKEIIPDYYHSDEDLRDQFAMLTGDPAYFVLNLEKNAFTWQDIRAGTPFSLQTVTSLCVQYPIFLALNFQAGEVLDILATLPVKGLQLSGGDEESVGLKSFEDLDEILDLLEDH